MMEHEAVPALHWMLPSPSQPQRTSQIQSCGYLNRNTSLLLIEQCKNSTGWSRESPLVRFNKINPILKNFLETNIQRWQIAGWVLAYCEIWDKVKWSNVTSTYMSLKKWLLAMYKPHIIQKLRLPNYKATHHWSPAHPFVGGYHFAV